MLPVIFLQELDFPTKLKNKKKIIEKVTQSGPYTSIHSISPNSIVYMHAAFYLSCTNVTGLYCKELLYSTCSIHSSAKCI